MTYQFRLLEEPFDFSSEFDEYEGGLLESEPEFEPETDEFEMIFSDLEEEEEARRSPRAPGSTIRGRTPPGQLRRAPPRRRRPPRTIIRPWRGSAVVIHEPSPCTCPEQTCPQHGSEYIRWVQSSLNRILGMRLPLNGVLTPATRSAIRSFQEREKLPVTGIVGPDTERALIAARGGRSAEAGATKPVEPGMMEPPEPAATPPELGMTEPAEPAPTSPAAEFDFEWEAAKPRPDAAKPPAELVSFAQRVLNAAEGERLDDDGELGQLTRDGLARFRTRYGLGPGGVLDGPTELALVQRAIQELAQQSIFPQLGVLDAKTGPAIARFKSERGLGFDATIDAATHAALTDALSRRASAPSGSVAVGALDRIIQVASQSKIARYRWRDRGVSPPGYIKGMALVYARVYCKLKARDAVATEIAKANTGHADKDALAHYAQEFNAVGMANESPGVDTLRHLFVLLIGLGMRESSGSYCRGRDKAASNTSADTAEAGLFQTSFNARGASPLLPQLFQQYLATPSGFLEIFKEGARCRDSDRSNFGSGPGKEFQRLSKECPAFAAEFTAVALRSRRKPWGPINRKTVEIRPECDAMLSQVQKVVDEYKLCPVLR